MNLRKIWNWIMVRLRESLNLQQSGHTHPYIRVGRLYYQNQCHDTNQELCPRYKYILCGVQLHSSANLGCSVPFLIHAFLRSCMNFCKGLKLSLNLVIYTYNLCKKKLLHKFSFALHWMAVWLYKIEDIVTEEYE